MLHEAFGIEVKELSIGELSKLIFNVEFILLGGQVVGRGDGIEIGEITRDVRCLSSFVTIHGCHGCFVFLVEDKVRILWRVGGERMEVKQKQERNDSGEKAEVKEGWKLRLSA